MAEIGNWLIGKYEALDEIRRGGMASVYLAVDRELNKQWAIKEIHKTDRCRVGQDSDITDTLAESNLMKRLNHPLIPRVEEVIIQNTSVYIVMEHLAGRTLDCVLRENGPLPFQQVIQIGIQLCEVLEYLHTCDPKVIYCDLKPANIMLQNVEPVSIKLFDFGISFAVIGCKKHVPHLIGTRGFAAPEQYDTSEIIDVYSDIFGLGATLYNLYTGNLLTEMEQREALLKHDSNLDRVILKCTEKDPRDRYQDCKTVKEKLEEALVADTNNGALDSALETTHKEVESDVCKQGSQTLNLDVTAPLDSAIIDPVLSVDEVKRELGFSIDKVILGFASQERI